MSTRSTSSGGGGAVVCFWAQNQRGPDNNNRCRRITVVCPAPENITGGCIPAATFGVVVVVVVAANKSGFRPPLPETGRQQIRVASERCTLRLTTVVAAAAAIVVVTTTMTVAGKSSEEGKHPAAATAPASSGTAATATAAAAAAATTMYLATARPPPSIKDLVPEDQKRVHALFETAMQWVHRNISRLEISAEDVARPGAPIRLAQLVLLICSAPGNIAKTDSDGNCCLHLFAAAGLNEFVCQLPRDAIKAQVGRRNRHGDTPLHSALLNVDSLGAPLHKNPMWAMCQTLMRLGAARCLPLRNSRGISPAYLIFKCNGNKPVPPSLVDEKGVGGGGGGGSSSSSTDGSCSDSAPAAAAADNLFERLRAALLPAIEAYTTWCLSAPPDAPCPEKFGGCTAQELYSVAWSTCMFGEYAQYHLVSVPVPPPAQQLLQQPTQDPID